MPQTKSKVYFHQFCCKLLTCTAAVLKSEQIQFCQNQKLTDARPASAMKATEIQCIPTPLSLEYIHTVILNDSATVAALKINS